MSSSRVIDVEAKPAYDFSQQYFHSLPFDARFNKVSWAKFAPINGLSDSSTTVRFCIPPTVGNFSYNLNQLELQMKIQISQEDGTVIPPDSKVSFPNAILYQAIRSLKLYFNKKTVISISNYALYGYLTTILNTDLGGARTFTYPIGYIEDDDDDATKALDHNRVGWQSRRLFFGEVSKADNKFRYTKDEIEFRGCLPLPIDAEYTPNNVEVRTADCLWSKNHKSLFFRFVWISI